MAEKIIKDRAHLSNIISKLTKGKTPDSVNTHRMAIKRLVQLEAALIVAGKASAMLMLRKEAKNIAKKMLAKKK